MSDTTNPDFLSPPHRHRASRPTIIAGAILGVIALVGTWVFARSSSSADATYRTATAGVHEVTTTLDRVATVEPVTQAAVSFPVSGTVSSVAVKVGDTVTTGQALGSLDTASLQSTLVEKEASLAEAELTLEKELNGEKVGGTGSVGGDTPTGATSEAATGAAATTTATAVFAVAHTTTTSASSTAAAAVATAPATSSGPSDDQLRAARQAIVDAQKAVGDATAAAATALDEATKVCASIGSASDGSAGTTGTGADTAATTTTRAGSDASDAVSACQTATQAVLAAQQKVSTDQAAVTAAADAYTDLLDQRASSGTSDSGGNVSGGASGGTTNQGGSIPGGQPEGRSGTTSPDTQAPSGSSGGSGTTGDSRSGSPTSPSTAPSAADLIADQKAVDAAEAAVAVARQAVAQASIVSPIDGTVVSVGFAPGASVTGGSSTETVVVVGQGGYEVATTVIVEDLPNVKVGQAATITLDGSSAVLSGQVVRIGVSPTSTSDTTYPVVIAITEASKDLRNGATASVSIVTDEATRVLAVPTSAVTRTGDRATVGVLSNGSVSRRQVTLGAIGREWTEIRSGLKAGATVVLADLSEALPGSATSGTSSNSNRTGQFGGFGGAGGFVGRPPGGGPPGG